MADPLPTAPSQLAKLAEVARLFLRLGVTAFGGPAAYIAMMEDEVVTRRRWIARDEFLDRLGAANLIPGPTATEVVIFLGYLRAGWPGLVVAGVCFIVPAAVMVACFAWAYVRFGGLPQVGRFLYGLKPVVIAIVAQALWKLGRTAVKTRFLGVAGIASIGAAVAGGGALIVLAGAGVVAALRQWWKSSQRGMGPLAVLLLVAGAALVAQFAPFLAASAQPRAVGLGALFLYFVKIGSVLYGSGYEAFLPREADASRPRSVRVVGKHCETGDVVVADGFVPEDLAVGDVLCTPVTGAYGHAMASNYNKVPRPAVVFVADGQARTVVRRETFDDLVRLDI